MKPAQPNPFTLGVCDAVRNWPISANPFRAPTRNWLLYRRGHEYGYSLLCQFEAGVFHRPLIRC